MVLFKPSNQHGMVWQGKARRGKAGLGFIFGGFKMKTVAVEITGVTSLLIHKFTGEQEKSTRKIQIESLDPRTEATKVAYIAPDGSFYFSAFAIMNAMASAGVNHKARGTRKSLKFVVPSAVRMLSDAITILDSTGKKAKDFEVDARSAVIPATKGRIMRYRPRFDSWMARFSFLINDSLLAVESAHQLLAEAGDTIGIGDFRPEKRGPFGMFRVTSFK